MSTLYQISAVWKKKHVVTLILIANKTSSTWYASNNATVFNIYFRKNHFRKNIFYNDLMIYTKNRTFDRNTDQQ